MSTIDREEQIKRQRRCEVFGGLSDQNPIWMELIGVLDEEFEFSLEQTIHAETQGEDRAWQAGYSRAVRNIKETLQAYRRGWHEENSREITGNRGK